MDRRFDSHLQTVCAAYGIVPSVTPRVLRGGYVAYVHRIDATDGNAYFAKTYDDARPITAMILPTLNDLSCATRWLITQPGVHGRIVAPLLTHEGNILVRDGPFTTVLFPFVDGVTPREQPLTAVQLGHLVDTIAAVHHINTQHVAVERVPRERFRPTWLEDIEPALTRICQVSHPLHTLLAGRVASIRFTFCVFRRLAAELAVQVHPLVVCHTDIHGYNVVIRDDIPLLIDWEGMTIAPPEHDLMFWINDDAWSQVWQRYRQAHPAAVIDPFRLRFYQLRRLFEDIIQDIQRVENEQPDAASMAELIESIGSISAELSTDWGHDDAYRERKSNDQSAC